MSNPPVVETDATGGFGAASYERPVPRISIDAFCEFPDTLSELEHAAADRRLSKAHVNVQSGGVVGAVKFFADHPTPNLIIVETRGQGEEVIAELEQLATVCDETTKVVVVGRVNDVQLYRELMRRGVSEYLVAPLNTLQIIETIAEPLRHGKSAADRPRRRIRRRPRRRRRLDARAQCRLVHRRGSEDRHRHHRFRPGIRHRRIELQRRHGSGRRRCSGGSRTSGRRPARSSAGQVRRSPFAVRRARFAGSRLRYRERSPMKRSSIRCAAPSPA